MDLLEHLKSRHYDTTKYKNHVVDEDNKILTVYLTNLSGQFVGFQQYNPKAMKSWLHTLPYTIVGIGDNDSAGLGMQRIAGEGFQSPKDLDEYTLDELHNLLKGRGYA